MQIAILGLGRMGMQIAKRLHKNNFDVFAWNRSEDPRKEFEKFVLRQGSGSSSGKVFAQEKDLVAAMTDTTRAFWVMLPQEIIEEFLFGADGLVNLLRPGDILVEGGNSFYKDSVRRAQACQEKQIVFYDAGISGGVWGEKNGFAIMVGGPKEHWQSVEPIFKTLSSGDNYGLVGTNGAGHFVKMVHNGIEYGMMEAIAEGYSILEKSPFLLDLAQVTKIYQKGSVISSWLIDLMANIFDDNKSVAATRGKVAATGEGEWTVKVAKELGVDARVIEAALEVRRESEDPKNQEQLRNKILALLRKQFGGHGVESNKE